MDIFTASSLGDIVALKKIINSGVDVNECDDNQLPPIAFSKNAAIAKILIESGAFITGMAGEAPIVQKLIDRVSSGESDISALTIIALQDGSLNSDWNGLNGDYAIHAATRTGNKAIVRAIADAGGSINLLSNDGESTFGIAANLGDDDLLELLVDLSNDPPTTEHYFVNSSVVDEDAAEEMIEYSFSLIDWAFNHKKQRILDKLASIGILPHSEEPLASNSQKLFFVKDPSSFNKSSFTNWFNPETLPVYDGVYQATPNPNLTLGNSLYALWNGSDGWSNATPDPIDLLEAPSFTGRKWFWRGLKAAEK